MTILRIVKYPDPGLKVVTARREFFDDNLGKLLDDMKETMYQSDGIGLAAPQVGVQEQVAVVDVSKDRSGYLELVNPEIVGREGDISSEEGCLSIPDYRDTIRRSSKVIVRASSRLGKVFELEAEGLQAICLQHEIDHLNGILFIDHLSRLKREFFKKWFKKRQEFGE